MSLGRRWAALPRNVRGGVLVSLSAFTFTAEALCVRLLAADHVPLAQIVLARCLGQFLWAAPRLSRHGLSVLRTARPRLHALRGISSVICWAAYYFALDHLSLALGSALSFTSVMFAILLAWPLLGERVGPARWAATLMGFAGVLLMLRPDLAPSGIGAAAALVSALAWAGIMITTRMLSATESTATIMLWVGMVALAFVLPVVAPVLVWPGWRGALVMLAMAASAPGSVWFVTEGLRAGETSAVAPMQYLRLVVMAGAGYLLFGETVGWITAFGAALIIGSAAFLSRHEARRAREEQAR